MGKSIKIGTAQPVGEQIKEARRSVGLTQKELGERIGVGGDCISVWERGARRPTIHTLARIADALGYSIEVELRRGVANE